MGQKRKRQENLPLKSQAAMPLLRNYSSRPEWETACWRKLLESKELLDTLVTPDERHNIILRAAALDSIAIGKNYKQIGQELLLSPQTVSVIKKSIGEKNYRSYRQRSKKERRKRKYSPDHSGGPKYPLGKPRRTKYGTVYLPEWR